VFDDARKLPGQSAVLGRLRADEVVVVVVNHVDGYLVGPEEGNSNPGEVYRNRSVPVFGEIGLIEKAGVVDAKGLNAVLIGVVAVPVERCEVVLQAFLWELRGDGEKIHVLPIRGGRGRIDNKGRLLIGILILSGHLRGRVLDITKVQCPRDRRRGRDGRAVRTFNPEPVGRIRLNCGRGRSGGRFRRIDARGAGLDVAVRCIDAPVRSVEPLDLNDLDLILRNGRRSRIERVGGPDCARELDRVEGGVGLEVRFHHDLGVGLHRGGVAAKQAGGEQEQEHRGATKQLHC
jgi:hypothetical protein